MRCKSQGWDDTELTSEHDVKDYINIKKAENIADLADLVKLRFTERYLDVALRKEVHGFTCVAICCLLIEALQSFKEGLRDTRDYSRQMFENFITDPESRIAEIEPGSFYSDIRCGILHQAETRNGWKIRKDCDKLIDDENGFTILDAEKLAIALRDSIEDYYSAILSANWHDDIIRNCVVKMDAVIRNCKPKKAEGEAKS